jgi:hypothetical protein
LASAVVVGAVALAMALSGVSVYAWQHAKVVDAEGSAAAANSQLGATSADAASLRAQVASLRWQAGTLEGRLEALLTRRGFLSGRLEVASGQVRALGVELLGTRGRLASVRARLGVAHGRALLLGGPAVADGRYVGRIEGVDAGAAPPRIAVDVRRRADGTPLALPGWRVFPVDPAATVRLLTWKSGADVVVPLAAFEHVFDGRAPWNAAMRGVRYWIRVIGGEVTRIGEHESPAP